MVVDGGVVKSWSSMQTTVAQSSGEAEYYAMVRAAAEALGLQSIMRDLGWHAAVRLWVDSSAAKSMSARIGLGKVRHMEVKFLWLQEAVKDKRIEVKKILGAHNPADALTKPKACSEVAGLLRGVGVHIEDRRPRPVYCAMKKKPEKTPITKLTTTTPLQGRTEAYGPGAETCGEQYVLPTIKPLTSEMPTMALPRFVDVSRRTFGSE